MSEDILDEYNCLTQNKDLISIREVSNVSRNDFTEELKICVKDITKKGNDVLAYDLTHPQIRIPVVRVMIPNLQPNFLMHEFHYLHKNAAVTPHLNIYEEVIENCKRRKFHNQKIDEIVELE